MHRQGAARPCLLRCLMISVARRPRRKRKRPSCLQYAKLSREAVKLIGVPGAVTIATRCGSDKSDTKWSQRREPRSTSPLQRAAGHTAWAQTRYHGDHAAVIDHEGA